MPKLPTPWAWLRQCIAEVVLRGVLCLHLGARSDPKPFSADAKEACQRPFSTSPSITRPGAPKVLSFPRAAGFIQYP